MFIAGDRFTCRDCGEEIVLPASYGPGYKERVVQIGVSANGDAVWDKLTKHLCVTDFDGYESEQHATCKVGNGHPLSGRKLNLAMIQRAREE